MLRETLLTPADGDAVTTPPTGEERSRQTGGERAEGPEGGAPAAAAVLLGGKVTRAAPLQPPDVDLEVPAAGTGAGRAAEEAGGRRPGAAAVVGPEGAAAAEEDGGAEGNPGEEGSSAVRRALHRRPRPRRSQRGLQEAPGSASGWSTPPKTPPDWACPHFRTCWSRRKPPWRPCG